MENLLTHTRSLINHVYWFRQDFNLKPAREHIGSSIEWTDITDRRSDFIRELVNTVASWVYNKTMSKKIIEDRMGLVSNDVQNAYSFLVTQAFSKFRPGYPQGQLGELLLFNFIQYFFEAVPLLRKQRITTSIGHERFGADAIHFKKTDKNNVIILGESKCYTSDYQFKNAFETSLSSIVNTVKNFNNELDLYIYDDFIEQELEEIAKMYKSGLMENVYFELVCLIAYNETKIINGVNEFEIKDSIKHIIEDRCNSLGSEIYNSVEIKILNRINYIIFPIWDLDKLLTEFKIKIGSI